MDLIFILFVLLILLAIMTVVGHVEQMHLSRSFARAIQCIRNLSYL